MTALIGLVHTSACAQTKENAKENTKAFKEFPDVIKNSEKYNALTDYESWVIVDEGTERPFTGNLNANKKEGTYICKQCNQALFRSKDKFNSGTGWPSFDDIVAGGVKEISDADGFRVEIQCDNCGAHLGHVFRGEGFTKKMTRHCVNSASLNFVEKEIQ